MWIPITKEELRALDEEAKRPHKKTPHQPRTLKRLPWLRFYRNCGLVYLNNELTRKALKEGC